MTPAQPVEANGRRIRSLPKVNTILQLAQLLSILGGIVYLAFEVGRRDAVLETIAKSQEDTARALIVVREDVANIKGQLQVRR